MGLIYNFSKLGSYCATVPKFIGAFYDFLISEAMEAMVPKLRGVKPTT